MTTEQLTIVLKSTAFEDGRPIPRKYTGDGDDGSPPLTWSGVPDAAKSQALICEDPDAPRGTWTHWILFNLPAETRELPEGVAAKETLPDGSMQGTNDFRKTGYGGPAPPPGKPHRYHFKLYALDAPPQVKAGATRQQLLTAMEGHILAQGSLMGTYGRSK
jgi:Raf kinase inhibitor-like YbhB/YbcL family protein